MPEMVFVQGGIFTMGATPEQEDDYYDDEKPAHYVTLSSFYIGKYPVTQEQWRAVIGDMPFQFEGDNLPMREVNWHEIQEFIKIINEKSGKQYRLPTEAEWEYAARGGNRSKGFKYSGSNNIDEVAWYSDSDSNLEYRKANELGIYDMCGNVWEWCYDWYRSSYSDMEEQTNSRVLRGGSRADIAKDCRVSNRYAAEPNAIYKEFIGFRLALDLSNNNPE